MNQTLMISVSGIRGIVGKGLDPEKVVQFTAAFGNFMNGGKIVVGRDARPTGEMTKHAVISSLLATGCDVVDVDLASTPTIQLAVKNLNANGGIAVTASHNPIEWNAIKLLGKDGLFLDAEQGEEVIQRVNSGEIHYADWQNIGKLRQYEHADHDHLEAILNLPYIHIDEIRKRRYKIVVDAVNSVGGIIVPQLLKKLGCEVIELNCEPTGFFTHTPEPLPENLTELAQTVKTTGADLGIAVDPDVDRLAFISEDGESFGEEYTLVLASDFYLGKKRGLVVTNLSTTRALDDIAHKHDTKVERSKVGEIYVVKKMQKVDAVIGGEGNGGVILPDVHLGRDAPVGIALALQHLTDFGGSLSELRQTFPQYHITKSKVELGSTDPKKTIEALIQRYQNEELDVNDGVKIIRENSWIHLRGSNTEPIIRIYTEAKTSEESQKLCDAFMQEINSLGK